MDFMRYLAVFLSLLHTTHSSLPCCGAKRYWLSLFAPISIATFCYIIHSQEPLVDSFMFHGCVLHLALCSCWWYVGAWAICSSVYTSLTQLEYQVLHFPMSSDTVTCVHLTLYTGGGDGGQVVVVLVCMCAYVSRCGTHCMQPTVSISVSCLLCISSVYNSWSVQLLWPCDLTHQPKSLVVTLMCVHTICFVLQRTGMALMNKYCLLLLCLHTIGSCV